MSIGAPNSVNSHRPSSASAIPPNVKAAVIKCAAGLLAFTALPLTEARGARSAGKAGKASKGGGGKLSKSDGMIIGVVGAVSVASLILDECCGPRLLRQMYISARDCLTKKRQQPTDATTIELPPTVQNANQAPAQPIIMPMAPWRYGPNGHEMV